MLLIESTSGTGNETWTYSGTQTPNNISFANDGDSDASLVILEQTIIVKPGEVCDLTFAKPFYEVAITTVGAWRMLIGR